MRYPPQLRRSGAAGAGGRQGDQARLTVPLYTESSNDAALDVAISHCLLNDAASAGHESLRVWIPPPALSFGRLDLLAPQHEQAAAVARAACLEPVRRLAGGRAAAIGPGTACLGWACASHAMAETQERYETVSALLVAALARLGIDATIRELPGEWCAGAWSVVAGNGKVGGLAQRVIRGGAWAEALVVVTGSAGLRSALDGVQRALGARWTPSTLTALADIAPILRPGAVTQALIDVLAERWDLAPAPLPAHLWDGARALREAHAV